uniref:RNB domain-containing protein n=1 Tax=Odontella aurita TaxID=265563 RepID=A0A7S4ML99_9STRA|mmetsp:Transcript_25195/g.73977  ORF Transcript_25195/g.73977 Transcript_25195/m.73977 type:complete len:1370 (+) Transcript_25195:379-4488(+)
MNISRTQLLLDIRNCSSVDCDAGLEIHLHYRSCTKGKQEESRLTSRLRSGSFWLYWLPPPLALGIDLPGRAASPPGRLPPLGHILLLLILPLLGLLLGLPHLGHERRHPSHEIVHPLSILGAHPHEAGVGHGLPQLPLQLLPRGTGAQPPLPVLAGASSLLFAAAAGAAARETGNGVVGAAIPRAAATIAIEEAAEGYHLDGDAAATAAAATEGGGGTRGGRGRRKRGGGKKKGAAAAGAGAAAAEEEDDRGDRDDNNAGGGKDRASSSAAEAAAAASNAGVAAERNSPRGEDATTKGRVGDDDDDDGRASSERDAAAAADRPKKQKKQQGRRGNDTKESADGEGQKNRGGKTKKKGPRKRMYPSHAPLDVCLKRYLSSASDPHSHELGPGSVIRGKLRAMPSKSGSAFVTCDRGFLKKDVMIEDSVGRNRALNGDAVFVELIGLLGEEDDEEGGGRTATPPTRAVSAVNGDAAKGDDGNVKGGNEEDDDVDRAAEELEKRLRLDDNVEEDDEDDAPPLWQDDDAQRSLWDPSLPIQRRTAMHADDDDGDADGGDGEAQYGGRVICVCPPKSIPGASASELDPSDKQTRNNKRGEPKASAPSRTIVGPAKLLPGAGRWLLEPRNKSLPRFMCPPGFTPIDAPNSGNGNGNSNKGGKGGGGGRGGGKGGGKDGKNHGNDTKVGGGGLLYRAEYHQGAWSEYDRWPPCRNVRPVGDISTLSSGPNGGAPAVSSIIEYETEALLAEHDCDHGEFSPSVLRETETAVRSGLFPTPEGLYSDVGWKPTPAMLCGRRDFRNHRIFTIDPTTAKDLDDALHVSPLPDGRVEIGVHIADVSHFISPESDVDIEAARRATTVYLVDRTVPMLPRKLCEVACSLNEDVERLAFSCVWRMNLDGTLENRTGGGKGRKGAEGGDDGVDDPYDVDVWYGKSVIKSCARLDYATAQNIIERKVVSDPNTPEADLSEDLWPASRRPTGGHTVAEVASDVRLMHKVAMARRAMRFENGALTLNGIKMTFQLGGRYGGAAARAAAREEEDEDDDDWEGPELAEPYPIRDSNRLVEEYMLLANYLVAQRLLSHAGGRALIRSHPPPLRKGLANVVDIAKESINYHLDMTTSQSLQSSLSHLGRTCHDALVMQCITELLMVPMKPATYIAAGEVDSQLEWRHFALNIPYYTHFTSPIRRYADVIVHRLLMATLDGPAAVEDYPQSSEEIHEVAEHCNEKKAASKAAQDRSDRVFLSLYLKSHPQEAKDVLGVVLSVGERAFMVYVPRLGMSGSCYTEQHEDVFTSECHSPPECEGEGRMGGGRRRIVMTRRDAAPVGANDGGGNNGGEGQPAWRSVEIKVFAKVRVSCSCRDGPPVDVSIRVEGPWEE